MSTEPSIDGPLARIDRANENLRNLERECRTFRDTRPYLTIAEPDANPFNRTFRVTHVEATPLRLRVLVGEIAHHLRSALDLLVYQLFLCEHVNDPRRLEQSAFPIVVECDFSSAGGRKIYEATMRRKIRGVSGPARARIESLQPCHAGNGNEQSFLAQIDTLDKIDKHRLLLALLASTHLHNFTFHDGTGQTLVFPDAYVPLQAGAVFTLSPVQPHAGDMHMNFKLPLVVAFGEPGPTFNEPVVPTLQNLSNIARDTLRLFSDCF